MKLKIKKLHPNAICPSYAYKNSQGISLEAGIDLFAYKPGIILENNCTHIETGIAIQTDYDLSAMAYTSNNIPSLNLCLFIKSKSGLSFKHNLEVGAGVIDSTFQGEIKIKVYNFSNTPYKYERGQKIAQIVPLLIPIIKNFEVVNNFNQNTLRDKNGFGSTSV
jgi:dUTP pyrophosphatase